MLNTEIVLIDLVDFSRQDDINQRLIVEMLNSVVETEINLLSAISVHRNDKFILGFIPTGDGFYAILHPGVYGYGVLFALGIKSLLLNKAQEAPELIKGVRVAVHAGRVAPFLDVTQRLNL